MLTTAWWDGYYYYVHFMTDEIQISDEAEN